MRLSKKKDRTKRVAECDLCRPVRRFLSEEGYTQIVEELQFFERSIDVYGVAPGDKAKTVAVELKLTKWQKALQQAALYQLCSDYSYVAMPKDVARGLEPRAFRAAGIGILAVDTISKAVEIVLPAILSKQSRGHYISAYKEMLRR
jgi:hypothetical protein